MSEPHGQGPPRSTVADAISLILAHYVAIASRGPYAVGALYAAGDQVASDGRVYTCFSPGTSVGAGPTGMGSQARRDGDGVGWTPFVYVGERYLKQHGAPPRVVIVPGNGEIGPPRTMGAGNIAKDVEELRAYIWAAENLDDIGRYAAIEAMKDAFLNILRKILVGRIEMRSVNPTITSNIVTFGEDRQLVVKYERQIPRDAAIWNVPIEPRAPGDPDRPHGDTGFEFNVETPVVGSR